MTFRFDGVSEITRSKGNHLQKVLTSYSYKHLIKKNTMRTCAVLRCSRDYDAC